MTAPNNDDTRMKYVVRSTVVGASLRSRGASNLTRFSFSCAGECLYLRLLRISWRVVILREVLLIPTTILRIFRVAPPSDAFWIAAVLLSACAGGLLPCVAVFIRRIRRHVLELTRFSFFGSDLAPPAMCFSSGMVGAFDVTDTPIKSWTRTAALASPLKVGRQFESTLCAPPSPAAAVAHL